MLVTRSVFSHGEPNATARAARPVRRRFRVSLRAASNAAYPVTGLALALGLVVGLDRPVAALTRPPALAQASDAIAKVDDYRMTIAVHEIAGDRTEDKTYAVLFKKPSLERIDVVAGPDKGAGVVWRGGDQVKAHHGGLFRGIHLTLNVHDKQVLTLRGDSPDTATIPAMLAHFATTPGTLSQAPGPVIDGAESTAVTLEPADPIADRGVTREVLYLSNVTHYPVRRESYIGTQLVKSVDVQSMQSNVGLGDGEFPW